MQGPCEHCGNADKSKWLSQCLYKGSFASRTAFIRSTFDPPCACDAEDEGRRELVQSRRRMWLRIILFSLLTASILGGFLYAIHRITH